MAQGCNSQPHYNTIRDFNIRTKAVGYLALEATDFKFIGPDRSTVDFNSISICLQLAGVIVSTNKPNY